MPWVKDSSKGLVTFIGVSELLGVLSDLETIVRLAEEVGLDGAEVRKIVKNKENTEKVTQDISESRAVGVQGVPFFVFDNKYAVSGAQPVEAFSQVLDQVWENEHAEK